MLAELASVAGTATDTIQSMVGNHPHPEWGGHRGGPGRGGPGWWLIFPILFWTAILSVIGYVIYRKSPKASARTAAERTLAERYARGEITAEEMRERRNVLRGKS